MYYSVALLHNPRAGGAPARKVKKKLSAEMVGCARLELATNWLKANCSTC